MSEFATNQNHNDLLVASARSNHQAPQPTHVPFATQTLGNQAAQRFAESCPLTLPGPTRCPFGGICHSCPAPVQAKLAVNQPRDRYEQEADQVAEQVMRMPEPVVQRACADCDDERIQTKPLSGQITPLIQRQVPVDEEEEEIQTRSQSIQRQAQLDEQEEEEEVQAKSAGPDQMLSITPTDRFTIQRRVDPARVNIGRCRTCITRATGGACTLWLNFNQDAILRRLTGPDNDAISLALRASHLLFIQRVTHGTTLYHAADPFTVAFRQALLNRFNLDIQNPAHHNRIRRVENRFQGIANLLQSGRMRYRCGCNRETNWAESYNNSSGNPRMWICRHYLDTGNAQERALTLLHECMHILYGLGHGGVMNNIYRYEQFATDLPALPNPAMPAIPAAPAAAPGGAGPAPAATPRAGRGGDDDLHVGLDEDEEEPIQAKPAGRIPTRQKLGGVTSALSGRGQPMPSTVRGFFEPRFGHNFGHVQIHTGPEADHLARAMNAKAFTLGRHIVFGSGQYEPGSSEGQRLMAHELTHVVQQSSQSKPQSEVENAF